MAEEAGLPLTARASQVVNRILDTAIAAAVAAFSDEQSAELQRRRNEHFAFVAHDIRTPLNAIGLTAAELRGAPNPPAGGEVTELLEILQRNVRRIDEMIVRVLEEERELDTSPGSANLILREFDLWPFIQRLISDLRPAIDAAQMRALNYVPRHVVVKADSGKLARVFQNLIGNALKFSRGGNIEIGARKVAKSVECWVRDDGPGIAQDRLAKIFEKEESDPDPTRAGFGLGLAIAREIVEAHGGQITAESEEGHGTAFRFTLP